MQAYRPIRIKESLIRYLSAVDYHHLDENKNNTVGQDAVWTHIHICWIFEMAKLMWVDNKQVRTLILLLCRYFVILLPPHSF